MRKFSILSIICLILSCGPTRLEVVEDYKPKFSELQTKLENIGKKALAIKGDIVNRNISPVPIFNEKDNTGNLNFLLMEEIKNPGYFKPYPSKDEEIPTITFLYDRLRDARRKVMTENYYNENSGSFKSDGELEKEFDEALGFLYLGLIETVEYRKPEIVDMERFLPGTLTLRVSIFNIETEDLLVSVVYTVMNDDTITVSSAVDEIFTIERDLWYNADKSLFEFLKTSSNLEYTPYK